MLKEKIIEKEKKQSFLKLVITGHVDHGKSSIIGRLLADTKYFPQSKLEDIRESCRKKNKKFAYAFLLDSFKNEQKKNITIDIARCFLKTAKRNYLIFDAPGHVEFLKKMITGAAQAETAIIIIDAKKGLEENTFRHGYFLSLLDISHCIVAINKMDLINYQQDIFKKLSKEYISFLKKIGISTYGVIPTSAEKGDNLLHLSPKTPWYEGKPLLSILENIPASVPLKQKPFRYPIQSIYPRKKEEKTIIMGRAKAGKAKIGDELIFSPSNCKGHICSFLSFPKKNISEISTGQTFGIQLDKNISLKRGEIASRSDESPPKISSTLHVKLFWLGNNPLQKEKRYILKISTTKIGFHIQKIFHIFDLFSLEKKQGEIIKQNDIAECLLQLEKPIAFDLADEILPASRFVIMEELHLAGGGIIKKAL